MKKYFLLMMLGLSIPALSQTNLSQYRPLDWKNLYQQLFYWNIEKHAVLPGQPKEDAITLDHIRNRAMFYSPRDPNVVYNYIRNSPSSEVAVKRSYEAFGFENNRKYLESKNGLGNVSGIDRLANSGAGDLLAALTQQHRVRIDSSKNYFDTEIGQTVLESLKDYLLVVVPGFGSHTMSDYTYAELVEAANTYYGRPAKREATKDKFTGEMLYVGENSPEQFYLEKPGSPELKLDVVHPLGYELGNSMTRDKDTAQYLKEWVEALPPRYKDKKIIFFGYSKGSPIAHNCVQLFPSMRKRTQLIVTLAGATQGSIAAQSGMDILLRFTRSENKEGAIQKLTSKVNVLRSFIRNLLGSTAGMMTSPEQADYFTGVNGSSIMALFGLVGKVADAKAFSKSLDGVDDLTNFQRIKWNLLHLNDDDFDRPLTVMNFSVITMAKDLFYPGQIRDDQDLEPPLVVPQFLDSGKINDSFFSRDAVFLHLTSILGFMQAPGGLFDTQVGWMDSKSMQLDQRPLSESLSDERLVTLAKEVKAETGFDLPKGFESMDRSQLLRTFNELRGKTLKNLKAIDLGDVRGNHWDISFRQVYKPETGKYYEHRFPRKAALTGLVETVALWVKSQEPSKETGGLP